MQAVSFMDSMSVVKGSSPYAGAGESLGGFLELLRVGDEKAFAKYKGLTGVFGWS